MTRGNWQRRIEQTEARRTAAKLQRRRTKSRSNSVGGVLDREASFRHLEEWFKEKGEQLLSAYGQTDGQGLMIDIWTSERPESRPEYLTCNFNHDSDSERYQEDSGKERFNKERRNYQAKKGKSHPNAKHKVVKSDNDFSILASKNQLKDDSAELCAQEFFFGREKCPWQQLKQKRGGGRSRSNSMGNDDEMCPFLHYYQFPKMKHVPQSSMMKKYMLMTPPLTLGQVVNGKYQTHQIHAGAGNRIISFPIQLKEVSLQTAFAAATFAGSICSELSASSNSDDKWKDRNTNCAILYHSRINLHDNSRKEQRHVQNNEQGNSSDASSLQGDDSDEKFDDNNIPVFQNLQQILYDKILSPMSLVYLTVQGILIYDCYRGGMIISHAEERFLVHGDFTEINSSSKTTKSNSDTTNHIYEEFNHHILDEILSFLEDEATSVIPQVCTSWRDELGTHSPLLWKMLLDRHNWHSTTAPDSYCAIKENPEYDESNNMEESQLLRSSFISHYSAARDIRAMVDACKFLHNNNISGSKSMRHKEGKEYAVHVYKSMKSAPNFDGADVTNAMYNCYVKIWPNMSTSSQIGSRALAAYPNDCTLRIFEAVQTHSDSATINSSLMKCRQIVCANIPTSSFSKKRSCCQLMNMNMDENVVACLFWHVSHYRHNPWLVIIPREDLICAGNEGILNEESIQTFDLRASVLDFLMGGEANLSQDDSIFHDSLREPLHNYLSFFDGDTLNINVYVSPTLIAYGKGYFIFHSMIHIPPLIHEDTDEASELFDQILGSTGERLFLYSIQKGAILYAIELDPYRITAIISNNKFSAYPNANKAVNFAASLNVVLTTQNELVLVTLGVNKKGLLNHSMKCIKSQVSSRDDVVVSQSHVIFSERVGETSVFHFFDIQSSILETSECIHCSIVQSITLIQDNYIVAIILRDNTETENEDSGWQWFEPFEEKVMEALLFHIPSHSLIYRSELPVTSLIIDSFENMLAFNVSTLGFALAGVKTREVAIKSNLNIVNYDHPCSNNKTPKVKKKRLASKITKKDKKDGFARGMSLCG